MAEQVSPPPPGHPPEESHPVDVEKLADKVYRLLLADARLGWARAGSASVTYRRGEG